jgi:pimeloyl-ACP methyl ester carboxylesterase
MKRFAATVLALFTLTAGAAQADSLQRSEYVVCDGAKLYLLLRGSDSTAPVLLWLHGGPGAAERPLFRYFNHELENHFAVAYWDQRGAGRSFDSKANPRDLTIARHVADLECVATHLRKELRRDRLILVGHSWGAALGLLYARDHPETVAAFIGVNPLISTRAQQQAEFDFVSQQANRRGDTSTLKDLQKIGAPPFTSAQKELAMEKLTQRYRGVYYRPPHRMWIALRGIVTGLVTPWGIRRIIHANNVTLQAMNRELIGLDLTRSVPRVDAPVLFFLGRHDHHLDAQIAARYLEKLRAPVKRVVWFENSAHNAPFEEPDLFDSKVVSELRAIGVKVFR